MDSSDLTIEPIQPFTINKSKRTYDTDRISEIKKQLRLELITELYSDFVDIFYLEEEKMSIKNVVIHKITTNMEKT